MTGAEALAFFTLELSRAAGQVGVPPPEAVPIHVYERIPSASALSYAYVLSCPEGFECDHVVIHVMWHALWGSDKTRLRCIARHEVSHVLLGHVRGAKDEPERLDFERQVRIFMRARWNQDSQCGLKPEKAGER